MQAELEKSESWRSAQIITGAISIILGVFALLGWLLFDDPGVVVMMYALLSAACLLLNIALHPRTDIYYKRLCAGAAVAILIALPIAPFLM